MKEHPILFSAPMVRAILDGTKTQTRRVVKPQPSFFGSMGNPNTPFKTLDAGLHCQIRCPYGQPGDRLWVREAHWWFKDEHDPVTGYYPPKLTADDVEYRADGDDRRKVWRPSIHMPRWASRITLEITGVRVERLQDISEADAKAEGCERLCEDEPGYVYREEPDWKICHQCGGTRLYTSFGPNLGACLDTDCLECNTYLKRYRQLWESINGPGSWDANPWVWVVEFKRITA